MVYDRLLEGKIALITGAGKGLGEATAKCFARAGAYVFASDIAEGSVDSWLEGFDEEFRSNVCPLYFDVSDESQCRSAILRIRKEKGRLDALVNNAGVMEDALIGTVTQRIIDKVYSVNVYGSMYLLQLAAKVMMFQHSGSIVNLSSIVGITGNPGQLVYSSSKGAIIAMTKTSAKELAPHGIRVNAIAPGMIDTDMMNSVGEVHLQHYKDNIPLGHRLGRPEEIGLVAVFLASDMASYLSGQIIAVDGCVLV